MKPEAYCVNRRFDVSGPLPFRMERHYFVHALAGVMRLEADGRRWTLPPARGALVAADRAVEITVLSPVVAASVLFEAAAMTPASDLAVFEMSPLCRELVRVCRKWGEAAAQDEYARQIFRALATEVRHLAETPSLCVMTAPQDAALARAIALTEEGLGGDPVFEEIARAVGRSPRTLARRFSEEMGMTWRETLRRLRIVRAMELLAMSDTSVTEVSLSVGYASLSGFNAAFRELTGMAPGSYRKSLSG